MTPTLAHMKVREVQSMYDALEPHLVDYRVALARQSLVAAAWWLTMVEQGRGKRDGGSC